MLRYFWVRCLMLEDLISSFDRKQIWNHIAMSQKQHKNGEVISQSFGHSMSDIHACMHGVGQWCCCRNQGLRTPELSTSHLALLGPNMGMLSTMSNSTVAWIWILYGIILIFIVLYYNINIYIIPFLWPAPRGPSMLPRLQCSAWAHVRRRGCHGVAQTIHGGKGLEKYVSYMIHPITI